MIVTPQARAQRRWKVTPAGVIEQFFDALDKHLICFAGYGELGYEEPGCVRTVCMEVLDPLDRNAVVVHCGTLLREGGLNGIADVYQIARGMGFTTTGLFPSIALNFHETHRVAPDCEYPFFIEDTGWGGFREDRTLSPTLTLHLYIAAELVVVGGGKYAAEELQAFDQAGKRVRYFPARMNASATRRWAQNGGLEIEDRNGAAASAWQLLRDRDR